MHKPANILCNLAGCLSAFSALTFPSVAAAQQYCVSGIVVGGSGPGFKAGDSVSITLRITPGKVSCLAGMPFCTAEVHTDIQSGARRWSDAGAASHGQVHFVAHPENNTTSMMLTAGGTLTSSSSDGGLDNTMSVLFGATFSGNLISGGALPPALPVPVATQVNNNSNFQFVLMTSRGNVSLNYTGQGCAAIAAAEQPKILLDEKDVTETTQTVIVGQQISLHAVPAQEDGQWLLQGEPLSSALLNIVGGYDCLDIVTGARSWTCSEPISPHSTPQSTTFYWTRPAAKQVVTYLYGSGDQRRSVRVTFNVSGPVGDIKLLSSSVTTIVKGISNSSWWADWLQLGGHTEYGVWFSGVASPHLGKLMFMQVLNDTRVVAEVLETSDKRGQEISETKGPVLDTVGLQWYDYSSPLTAFSGARASDSPAMVLKDAYVSATYDFNARLYLMWTSGLPNSIAIPLGSMSWHWLGIANKTPAAGWTVDQRSACMIGDFDPSPSFPIWTRIQTTVH